MFFSDHWLRVNPIGNHYPPDTTRSRHKHDPQEAQLSVQYTQFKTARLQANCPNSRARFKPKRRQRLFTHERELDELQIRYCGNTQIWYLLDESWYRVFA